MLALLIRDFFRLVHMERYARKIFFLCLTVFLNLGVLFGQHPQKLPAPIQQRGFSAEGEIQDTVNVFSGNVNVVIPLATLKTDNEFQFKLFLYYDSNVWNVGPGDPYPRTSDLRPRPFDTFNGLDPSAGAYSWNVSPGWLLHPGRIVETDPDTSEGAHFLYLGADFSQIPLYDKLHGSDPDESSGPDAFYSRDGSYLKFVSEDGATGDLFHPDGVMTRFVGGWFDYTEDRFGNRVDKVMVIPDDPLDEVVMVFRENRYNREIRVGLTPAWAECGPAGPCFNPDMGLAEWVEYQSPGVDGQGQPNTQRIEFERLPLINLPPAPDFCDEASPDFDGELCFQWFLDNQVVPPDAPAFCDSSDSSYDFDLCHIWQAEQGIQSHLWRRHVAAVPPLTDCTALDCFGRFDDITLYAGGLLATQKGPLTGISFPDGSRYEFKYGIISEVDGGPPGMMSGALSEMRLPTGGTITYAYGEFRVPDNRRPDLRFTDEVDCAANPQYCTDFWGPQMGVVSRKFFDVGKDPAVDNPDEETLYRRSVVDNNNITAPNFLDPAVVVNSDEESRNRDMVIVETSPLGDDTVHYFRTPEAAWDYGLGFTRHGTINNAFPSRGPGDIRRAYLSKELFEGPAVVGGQKGDLKQQIFVTFERDAKSPNEDFNNPLNGRLVYQRTVYYDDLNGSGNPHYTDLLMSQFDGYGHYRVSEPSGTFAGGGTKTTVTNYNPGAGNYVVFESTLGGDDDLTFQVGNGHNFNPRDADDPWILGNYDAVRKIENGVESHNEFFFDNNTGKLLRKRILAKFRNSGLTLEENRSSNDLLFVFDYHARGQLVLTRHFGGDLQNNIPSGRLDQINIGNLTPEYQAAVTYDFANGRIDSFIQDPQSGENLIRTGRMKYEIHTGLPLRQVDSDDVTTLLEHSDMLLEASSKHGTDTRIHMVYTPSNGTTFNKKTVTQGTSQKTTELDGLGRIRQTTTRFPTQTSFSEQIYENGVVVKKSKPTFNLDTATYTQYSGYDYLGRPTQIVGPDGKIRTIEYVGARLVRYRDKVVSDEQGNETSTVRTELYDPLGRLVAARRQFDDQRLHATNYSYDVHDQLIEVSMEADGITQLRQFVFDNREFMVAENHPEITGPGSADIVHALFDASGRVRETNYAGKIIRFVYHSSGNLAQVKEVEAGAERLLKDFYYDDENQTATNLTAGKLIQSRRFNYYPGQPDPIVVTNSLRYEDENGRISSMKLRTSTGWAFEQSFDYDSQGRVTDWLYPAKKITGVDPSLVSQLFGAEAQRTINMTYTKGFLTSVPAMTANINYHPHRVFFAEVHHTNGVIEEIQMENGIPRPSRIKATLDSASLWNSGAYSYDTSGNIAAIGNDRFTYDRSSQIKSAKIGTITETYTYDAFNNLTHFDDIAIGIDSNTNRLSNATYDNRGNLTQYDGSAYLYDAMNRIIRTIEDGVTERYIYDPQDNRLAILRPAGYQLWTIRDESGKVLKDYKREVSGGKLRKQREYVYAGDRLLGAFYTTYETDGTPTTVRRHYHNDHLGTPRLITNQTGEVVSQHTYLPFGEELTQSQGDPDPERLKFTSHERDGDNRDYFKARFYLPLEGRFFSPDPVLGRPKIPTTWNRYTYALNNPLKFNDPSGEDFELVFDWLSNLFLKAMEKEPMLRLLAELISLADESLASLNESMQDMAVYTAGDSDSITILILVTEMATPDSVAEGVWDLGTTLTTGGGASVAGKGTKGVLATFRNFSDDIVGSKAWKALDGSVFESKKFIEGFKQGMKAEVIGSGENIIASGKQGMVNLPEWTYAGTQKGFFVAIFGRGAAGSKVKVLEGGNITHEEQFLYHLGQVFGGLRSIALGLQMRKGTSDSEE